MPTYIDDAPITKLEDLSPTWADVEAALRKVNRKIDFSSRVNNHKETMKWEGIKRKLNSIPIPRWTHSADRIAA